MKIKRLKLNSKNLALVGLISIAGVLMFMVFIKFLISAVSYTFTPAELTLVSLIELVGYLIICYLADLISTNKKTHEKLENLESQL